ncbi:two-component system response regulator [Methylomonas sp. UP202]|uniref:response regulator n=1 Tax=Methylomonas sp. UP202 TaxID=3040943 RepID=UPI002478EA6B|nr:two-component system response regulator [Methylomonas sp. UP202]WGS87337.1 two-component system response regulator [Methylomonas sp. UP202]
MLGKTVLIVDDAPENLTVLSELLAPLYRVLVANSGRKALSIAGARPRPDLVLLDVMMPDMDGYQVFEQLRQQPQTADIPVIFVTAMDSAEAELQGLDAGAVDYIAKPITAPILLARVRNQLELKQSRDWLRIRNNRLESEIARRMSENEAIQDVSIRALARLAEIRDTETGNHILRTQCYVRTLAEKLTANPRFSALLTDDYIKLLAQSAPLHDIGKVGIPDAILRKPGPLDAQEWRIMKTHAKLGSDAIELAEREGAGPVAFLNLAKEIAHWHHEKWDGSGYPDGLSGDAIPLSARIMALADVFDALISRRVYKEALALTEVRRIIEEGKGRHFDPDLVEAFFGDFDAFRAIADTYRDDANP